MFYLAKGKLKVLLLHLDNVNSQSRQQALSVQS